MESYLNGYEIGINKVHDLNFSSLVSIHEELKEGIHSNEHYLYNYTHARCMWLYMYL